MNKFSISYFTIFYLLIESFTILFGFIDYRYIHRDNSMFINYPGAILVCLSGTGILLIAGILLNGLRSQVTASYYINNLLLLSIGSVAPVVIMLKIASFLN